MFLGIVGMIDDEDTDSCIRGNGKTCSLTYYLYRYKKEKGKKIWTNYETTFSDEVIGLQAMIDKAREYYDEKITPDFILGVTEMQDLINSIGSKVEETMFIDAFANQMRKLETDCLYDTQRLKNIHLRLRSHTENIFIPFKYHLDGEPCNFDRCLEKHFIDIHSYKPFRDYPIKRIKAWEVGKLYHTKDIIKDKLCIPKLEKENTKKNKDKALKKEFLAHPKIPVAIKELVKTYDFEDEKLKKILENYSKEENKEDEKEENLLEWSKKHG